MLFMRLTLRFCRNQRSCRRARRISDVLRLAFRDGGRNETQRHHAGRRNAGRIQRQSRRVRAIIGNGNRAVRRDRRRLHFHRQARPHKLNGRFCRGVRKSLIERSLPDCAVATPTAASSPSTTTQFFLFRNVSIDNLLQVRLQLKSRARRMPIPNKYWNFFFRQSRMAI